MSYLLDVVKQSATFTNGRDNRREVVISEDHVGSLFADIATVETHGDADISTFQRGRVVDTIASHHAILASAMEGIEHAELSGWTATSHNERQSLKRIKLFVGHGVEIGCCHHG